MIQSIFYLITKMKKENLEKCKEYLLKYGCLSIPFLQQKFNLSFKGAKALEKRLKELNLTT